MDLRPVGSLAEAARRRRWWRTMRASAPAIWCPTPWSGRYGQQVIVENPGLDTFFIEAARGPAWIGYHPHGDHVTHGGVAAVDAGTSTQTQPRRWRFAAAASRSNLASPPLGS